MFNLNRKYTAALKQMAEQTERLATAEEEIAGHLKEILRSDERRENPPARPCKNFTPPKNQPPRR
jgi:hypothetical protein